MPDFTIFTITRSRTLFASGRSSLTAGADSLEKSSPAFPSLQTDNYFRNTEEIRFSSRNGGGHSSLFSNAPESTAFKFSASLNVFLILMFCSLDDAPEVCVSDGTCTVLKHNTSVVSVSSTTHTSSCFPFAVFRAAGDSCL